AFSESSSTGNTSALATGCAVTTVTVPVTAGSTGEFNPRISPRVAFAASFTSKLGELGGPSLLFFAGEGAWAKAGGGAQQRAATHQGRQQCRPQPFHGRDPFFCSSLPRSLSVVRLSPLSPPPPASAGFTGSAEAACGCGCGTVRMRRSLPRPSVN